MDVPKANVIQKGKSRLTITARGALGISQNLTRMELQQFFLENVGIPIGEDLLTDIFMEMDEDGDNLVSAQDLANYARNINPRTKAKRGRSVFNSTVRSVTWWLLLTFIFGGVVFIQANIRARPTGDLYDTDHHHNLVGSWLFLVGGFGFVLLVIDYERKVVRQRLLTKLKLSTVLRWGT